MPRTLRHTWADQPIALWKTERLQSGQIIRVFVLRCPNSEENTCFIRSGSSSKGIDEYKHTNAITAVAYWYCNGQKI